MTWKAWHVSVTTLAALLVIAACSSSGDAGATNAQPSSTRVQAPSASAAASTTAAQPLTGKLTVWDFQYSSPSWGSALKAVDAAFIAGHPGVTIDHVGQPNGTYYSLIQAALASGHGPDVMMMLAGTGGVLSYTKSLEPLNSYITPELRSEIPSGFASTSTNFDPNRQTYGIPGSMSGWVFYYNKKLFAQAGLDPNSPPKTYAQLVADAAKLKAAGITPFGGGNADQYGAVMWLDDLLPGVFTKDESAQLAQGKISYTGADFTKVTNEFIQLYKAGYFDPGYASTSLFSDSVSLFNEGKQAMFAGIASDTVSYHEFDAGLGQDNVGVFYSPAASGSSPYYLPLDSGPVWTMNKTASNKALAWAYIDFMTGPEGAQIQWDKAGILPINTSVNIGENAPPQATQMLAAYKKGPTYLYVSSLMKQTVLAEWMKRMQLVLSGSESVSTALAHVQAKQDAPF